MAIWLFARRLTGWGLRTQSKLWPSRSCARASWSVCWKTGRHRSRDCSSIIPGTGRSRPRCAPSSTWSARPAVPLRPDVHSRTLLPRTERADVAPNSRHCAISKQRVPRTNGGDLVPATHGDFSVHPLPQVIMDDLAETESEVGKNVLGRDDVEDGQVGDRGQSVRHQRQRAWPGPGTFDRDILEIIFHQFAYPGRAIDMRDDLEEEIRRRKRGPDGLAIERLMLVAHRAGGDAHVTVIERADEHVDVGPQGWTAQFLRKSPELAAARDGRMIVEKHAMGVAAFAALE